MKRKGKLFEIGDNLRKIGENMCQQVNAQKDLDYRKIIYNFNYLKKWAYSYQF